MSEFEDRARYYAEMYGLDPELFVRQIQQESRFDPTIVSPAGAVGLAQIMPATAADPGFGVTPISQDALTDPEQSLRFGAEYMAALLDRYEGNMPLALAAYNAGAGTVDRAGGVPNIEETRNYVNIILGTEDLGGVTPIRRPEGVGPDTMAAASTPDNPETAVLRLLQAAQEPELTTEIPTCPPGSFYDAASGTCVQMPLRREAASGAGAGQRGSAVARFGLDSL